MIISHWYYMLLLILIKGKRIKININICDANCTWVCFFIVNFRLDDAKSASLIDSASIPGTSGMDQCCACWRMWDDGTWEMLRCVISALLVFPSLSPLSSVVHQVVKQLNVQETLERAKWKITTERLIRGSPRNSGISRTRQKRSIPCTWRILRWEIPRILNPEHNIFSKVL